MIWLFAFLLQFTSYRDTTDPRVLMAGQYQSCLEEDGTYSEKIYVRKNGKLSLWELHLGPNDEVALFAGELEDHVDHDDKRNLLLPSYRIFSVPSLRGDRNWSIPALNLHVNVVVAGGSRDDCLSFFIRVDAIDPNRKLARQ